MDVEAVDLTPAFLSTARGWHDHSAALAVQLRVGVGEAEFDEQQAARRDMIAAIEDGLLSRALFVATKPTQVPR